MGSRKTKQNELVYIPFTVFGTDGITPLTGQAGSCTYNLTLNNANAPEVVTIAEIGSTGYYYASFTPLSLGTYDLEITCPDDRVLGETLFCETNDLDDIKTDTAAIKIVTDNLPDSGALTDIVNTLTRSLGLAQENYYLDNTSYDTYSGAKLLTSGRLRIYSAAGSVGTANDVLATYTITAIWNNDELQTYKVVKQ